MAEGICLSVSCTTLTVLVVPSRVTGCAWTLSTRQNTRI